MQHGRASQIAWGAKQTRHRAPVKVQFGHFRRLPQDYIGERHRVASSHLPSPSLPGYRLNGKFVRPSPVGPIRPSVAHALACKEQVKYWSFWFGAAQFWYPRADYRGPRSQIFASSTCLVCGSFGWSDPENADSARRCRFRNSQQKRASDSRSNIRLDSQAGRHSASGWRISAIRAVASRTLTLPFRPGDAGEGEKPLFVSGQVRFRRRCATD